CLRPSRGEARDAPAVRGERRVKQVADDNAAAPAGRGRELERVQSRRPAPHRLRACAVHQILGIDIDQPAGGIVHFFSRCRCHRKWDRGLGHAFPSKKYFLPVDNAWLADFFTSSSAKTREKPLVRLMSNASKRARSPYVV